MDGEGGGAYLCLPSFNQLCPRAVWGTQDRYNYPCDLDLAATMSRCMRKVATSESDRGRIPAGAALDLFRGH